jgi:hypothetical protein
VAVVPAVVAVLAADGRVGLVGAHHLPMEKDQGSVL